MSNPVSQFSEVLGNTVEAVAPSVVRIEGGHGPGSSGVVWSPELIVTTHHTLDREDTVEVGLADGSSVSGELIGRDEATDLAVIKVAGKALTPARWAPLGTLKVGNILLAVARPGRTARADFGIVGTLGPEWRTQAGGKLEAYVQVNGGLQPGFSGGAMVTPEGEVIGVATAGLVRRYGLAIPTSTVRRVVEHVQQHGTVQRGFLGVGVYPVKLPEPIAQQVQQTRGALVLSVQSGSAAEKAGLTQGDVLISIDGHPIGHPGDLVGFLDEEKVGKPVKVRIARGGQVQELTLTVGTRA